MEKRLIFDLQFFGGRGAGESLSASSGKLINIIDSQDVWAIRNRANNAPYVDSINSSVRDIQNDFPDVMNTVNTVDSATLGGEDRTGTLGFYQEASGTLALNSYYTDIGRMNAAYDNSGSYHPGRGNKNAVEAVTYHEMGHALSDHIAKNMGVANLDEASARIVNDAYKATRGRGGTKAWAGKISGYAKESFAECVAEAVCDYYCNGSRANANSLAIMAEMRKYK